MPIVSSSRPKPEVNILDQRVPRNPKYENIQPTIDTGESVTKLAQRNEELRAAGKQQNGEIFKRIKISTLVQLIIQVTEINALETPKNYENDSSRFGRRALTNNDDVPEDFDGLTSRSTLQSVISGLGEMDVFHRYAKRQNPSKTNRNESSTVEDEDRPFLIVDLRDFEDFRTNHIVSAHHYPAAMLSRCTNNESNELLRYKNQKGKIIVVYDEEEHFAGRAATVMVERGYENIFLLSGGLKYAVRKFPRGLITGQCPFSWTVEQPRNSSRKEKRTESIDKNSRHEPAIGQSTVHVARPAPGPSIHFELREKFSHRDVEDLSAQLEANQKLIDSGTRLSRAQTESSKQNSRISNVSDRTHYSHISDKPWKP